MKLKYKPVLVEWVDSSLIEGWTFTEEISHRKPLFIETIGWLIHQSKKQLIVSSSLGKNPDQACGTINIPIVSINQIKEIDMSKSRDIRKDKKVKKKKRKSNDNPSKAY